MKEFWNERYREKEFAYGKIPNAYFKQVLDTLPPGKVLLAAEGEGRNAVYAAQLGWDVYACDISEAGYEKAMRLAAEKNVSINYQVCSILELTNPLESFDAIGLVFAHFPPEARQAIHQKLTGLLKVDGQLILEGFSKAHIEYQKANPLVGGPKAEPMLFSLDELHSDFPNFNHLQFDTEIIDLQEGKYHHGKTEVVRMHAIKK